MSIAFSCNQTGVFALEFENDNLIQDRLILSQSIKIYSSILVYSIKKNNNNNNNFFIKPF